MEANAVEPVVVHLYRLAGSGEPVLIPLSVIASLFV